MSRAGPGPVPPSGAVATSLPVRRDTGAGVDPTHGAELPDGCGRQRPGREIRGREGVEAATFIKVSEHAEGAVAAPRLDARVCAMV